MSRKSKFLGLQMVWEDYQIQVMPAPRSGYDVIFWRMNSDEEVSEDGALEIRRRHVADHDTAIGVLVTWSRQVEEGRIRK